MEITKLSKQVLPVLASVYFCGCSPQNPGQPQALDRAIPTEASPTELAQLKEDGFIEREGGIFVFSSSESLLEFSNKLSRFKIKHPDLKIVEWLHYSEEYPLYRGSIALTEKIAPQSAFATPEQEMQQKTQTSPSRLRE